LNLYVTIKIAYLKSDISGSVFQNQNIKLWILFFICCLFKVAVNTYRLRMYVASNCKITRWQWIGSFRF